MSPFIKVILFFTSLSLELFPRELLSKTITLLFLFFTRYFTIADPIKPLPPVTSIFFVNFFS